MKQSKSCWTTSCRSLPASKSTQSAYEISFSKSVPLADFLADPNLLSKAGLFPTELMAMLLYKTLAYKIILRLRAVQAGRLVPTASYYLFCPVGRNQEAKGFVRGRKKEDALAVQWRGMHNTDVAHNFTTQGGTEQAFMYTTRDLSVAECYRLSKNSLLFKGVSSVLLPSC